MFAALMAYAMGVKLDGIRHGLRTFDTTYFQAPGRLNVFDQLPFKVILDYGHNPAAVTAMVDLAKRLEVSGRRLCVLAAPGDRRDEDILDIARIAARGFDRLIVRRDDDLRGRPTGEVTALLKRGALETGFDPAKLEVVEDEEAAVDHALRIAERGDLLIVFGDKISRCWKQITKFAPHEGAERPAVNVGALAAEPARPLSAPVDVEGSRLEVVADDRGVRLKRHAPEAED
jgi:cyanophycin synthetase